MKTNTRQKTIAVMAMLLVGIGSSVWAKDNGAGKGLNILEMKAASLTATTNAPVAALGEAAVQYQVVNGKISQSFKVEVEGLPSNTTYQVFVTMSTTTNGTTVAAGAILTGAKGGGELTLKTKGKMNLPAELTPVTQILHVDVQDVSANSVLAGNIDSTAPDFRMEAKTGLLTPAGAATKGEAAIRAHKETENGQVQARQTWAVHAKKLAKKTTIQVRIDGTVVGTGTSNGGGNVNAGGDLPNTMDPSRVKLIELLDSANNVLQSGSLNN
jgi:hypothetical protein